MGQLSAAFQAASSVLGDDGRPMVDTSGVDRKQCYVWREQLGQIDEELVVWGRTFQRMYAASAPVERDFYHTDNEQTEPEADVYADAEEWDGEPTSPTAAN